MYSIGLPPSSRQPFQGQAYTRLRKLLGMAVPLENDGSTCVMPDVLPSSPSHGQDGNRAAVTPISALCRHNAAAASAAGKSGVAQSWLLLSQMVGIAEPSPVNDECAANPSAPFLSNDVLRSIDSCKSLVVDETHVKSRLNPQSSPQYSSRPLFHVPAPPLSVLRCKRSPVDRQVRACICVVNFTAPHCPSLLMCVVLVR